MDLSRYYAEICKEPILTKVEEFDLLTRYVDPKTPEVEKEKIKDRVIKANLRFAFKQAKTYSKNDPSIFPDLISAANEGLVVGLSKYSPERGVRFLSYAGWWVVQRMLEEMSNMRIVSLPKWKQQLASKILRVVERHPEISLKDLKIHFKELGVPNKDVEEMYNTRYLTYYIDDLEENHFEIDPISEEVQKRIDETKIWKSVNDLPSPHREIIAKSFGLEDGVEYPPAKLAKLLRMTKDEVGRIKKEGMDMLKEKMLTTGLSDL